MEFDAVIMGGGLAGLTAGLACQEAGLSTAVFSAGQSALHFSSGSLDVLGFGPGGKVLESPFEALADFLEAHPGHPYARVGPDLLAQAMDFIRNQAGAAGYELCQNGQQSHFHVTAMGVVKPTFLSPWGIYNPAVQQAFEKRSRIAILNFSGFRDFYPELAAAHLAAHPLFQHCEVRTGVVRLSQVVEGAKNPHEMRSLDLARLFDKEEIREEAARQIRRFASEVEFVAVPAVLGIQKYRENLQALHQAVDGLVYEVPTLPPSLPGMRLDQALKERYAALGGVFIAGDRATGGRIKQGRLESVLTKNNGAEPVKAKYFVLATGSFFTGGLSSQLNEMAEPVFNLQLDATLPRHTWYDERFLGDHPFLAFGVKTDDNLRPLDAAGDTVENLFAAGAVLSGYNPVAEGSGSGVAVSTGFHAARQIIDSLT